MKIKELIEQLNKCVPEAEIGIADFDGICEIQGVGLTLYGEKSITNGIYTIRATEELDEITEVSNSLNQEIDNNYITELQTLNRDLVELIASVVRTYDMQEEFGKLCNADKSLMENFNTDWIVVEKNWIEKARALLEKAEGVE